MTNPVFIIGSARNDGNTRVLVDWVTLQTGWQKIDLLEYDIQPFDYQHRNRNDDFLPLIKHIVTHHDTLVFVTPVYWYSMSGVLKTFFDRFTDLLLFEKTLGRQLRGKRMAVLTTSAGDHLGDDFWIPFQKTAEYLGMRFLGGKHMIVDSDFPGPKNKRQKDLLEFLSLVS